MNLNVILLHDHMVDQHAAPITAALTLIDLHDLARSARTYGVRTLFIAHPSPTVRSLARTVKGHWEEGFGATYNPNRKDALGLTEIVADLDQAIAQIDQRDGKLPTLIATSARGGNNPITAEILRRKLHDQNDPYLLMLGTGWGMSQELLQRADLLLEPLKGPTDYNHLSVRSACAIMLDRLCADAPSQRQTQ